MQEDDHYDPAELLSHSKRTKLESPPAPADPYTLASYLGLPAFRPWSPGKPGYQTFPFPIQQQPYHRSHSKEKIPEPRKYEAYGGATTTPTERFKDVSPVPVPPKKKYLEKGRFPI